MPEASAAAPGPIVERRSRNVALLFELIWQSAVFALILSLFFVAFIAVVPFASGTDISLAAGFALTGCFFAVVFALIAALQRRLRRQIGTQILVYPDRLEYIRKEVSVLYRWEDLQEFYCWGVNLYSSTLGIDMSLVECRYDYCFVHRTGHRFDFSEKFGSKGELPLASLVEKGLMETQLPLLRKRFRDDWEPVRFGPLALEHDGLRYGRSVLPWKQAGFVWAQDGLIRVKKRDSIFNWCKVKLKTVPHSCLFLALAKERLDEEETPTQDIQR